MKRFLTSMLLRALAGLCLLSSALTATSITYVGKETGNAVQNWSNPAVSKTTDLNGDDRFGGSGYYQITPGTVEGGTWSQDVPDGNDLGITELYPTQYASPSFLNGNPAGAEGTFLNFSSFPLFYDPTATTQSQQGVLWLIAENKTLGTAPGNVSGLRNKAFNFTLGKSASLRLGVAVDTLGESYAPDYVSVTNAATGEVFSAALERDGIPDMVFFDIGGNAGDVFEVALWQTDENIGTDGREALALITFDQAPTPTLSYSLNGNNITLSWEQNIPGWILESSTDLGVGDDWDPVPGVVNNSVSVSMTGVPKNFFRLRKDP